ncbi:MAG: alpha/beta fold hydrolase [Elusimicrobia bacterium]|nr:alpha/beta fold hydrolase [Elusimicrobiota bacterium]
MEMKKMVCIECPKSCVINVGIDNKKIVSVKDNECPKGEKYARQEIENPKRIITSTVLAEGLDYKMIPVKTDRPVPKSKILDVMQEIKKVRVKDKPVSAGDLIVRNILGLEANLVATRSASYPEIIQKYLNYYSLYFKNVKHVFRTFKSCGEDISYHFFIPDNYKATIVLVHGYLEHVGLSKNLIGNLIEQKYAVAVYDNLGHGLSGGTRAGVENFNQYNEVLKDFLVLAQNNLHGPFHLISHSMGGAVSINYLLNREKDIFDKILLIAPLVHPVAWIQTNIIYFVLKNFVKSVRRNLADGTSDKAFVKFFKNDPLVPGRISVSWVKALLEWNKNMLARNPLARKIKVVQGTKDHVVDWKYNLEFIKSKFTAVEIELIENADHNLCNETEPFRKMTLAIINSYFAPK